MFKWCPCQSLVVTCLMVYYAAWRDEGLIDKRHQAEKPYETNVTIYSHKKYMKFYSQLDDGMIWAGSSNQLQDSSQGDSGGPMVCHDVVHGIISYGYHFPPGVYTRIANYLPWIKQTVGSDL